MDNGKKRSSRICRKNENRGNRRKIQKTETKQKTKDKEMTQRKGKEI